MTLLATFLAGDWACVTKIGNMLLQNAFQASDPVRYPLNDPHLMVVFNHGVGLLNSLLAIGYDEHGWQLALECSRPPMGTSTQFMSAAERL